jgi:soluble lytic murein transglycosylase-like protein
MARLVTLLLLTFAALPAYPAVPGDARSGADPELRKLLVQAVSQVESFPDRFEAEVWLTDMAHRLRKQVTNPGERIEILKAVHYESSRANLPPELVLAIIEVESNFDRFAISHAGALGLMQVMPFWLKEIGRPGDNLMNLRTNLRMGCTILRYYMDMEPNNLIRALGRYNGSLGRRTYGDKVVNKLRRKWFRS